MAVSLSFATFSFLSLTRIISIYSALNMSGIQLSRFASRRASFVKYARRELAYVVTKRERFLKMLLNVIVGCFFLPFFPPPFAASSSGYNSTGSLPAITSVSLNSLARSLSFRLSERWLWRRRVVNSKQGFIP